MTTRYHFKYISAFQGDMHYEVWDRETGERTRVEFRTHIPAYEGGAWNYTKEEFDRDVAGSAYLLRGSSKIDWSMVEAFRNHLQQEWDDYLKHCSEKIAQYPGDEDIAHIYGSGPASPIVLGGAYWKNGWHRITACDTSEKN